MKLATVRDGSRDGRLAVVSRDLSRHKLAEGIAATMQAALDDWSSTTPQLHKLADDVENGAGSAFDPQTCHSPLPRAYQWADGSAYVNHVELVRLARGATMPDSFWTDPLMYQGGSDSFLSPQDAIKLPTAARIENWGIDFEGEVAVIIDDVPMGASLAEAEAAIRLVMLVNDVSLRGLIPSELSKGFGFFQSKPSSAFSPVAVTPDGLGSAWRDGKLCLPLQVVYNGVDFGAAHAGVDMTFNFPQLIAHAAKSRPLCAGTIIGSGTVSNKLDGGPGKKIIDGGAGYSCLAELRMIETISSGNAQTAFMSHGDTIEIFMTGSDGHDIFGSIRQQVVIGE
jgi:fumarylacetoacetate (FAA) hydrolase